MLHQLTLSKDISLSGNQKQLAKAKKALNPVVDVIGAMQDKEARFFIQNAIDKYNLNASILYRGHLVWSRKKITRNLQRIIDRGQLYGNKRVQWVRVVPRNTEDNATMACLPKVEKGFKPILSAYFYNFIISCCGSEAHYSRAGWIGIYPTVTDLKRFFMRNEKGKSVAEFVPEWKSDAVTIVADIERMLYPFRSFMKAQQKEDEKQKRGY